VYVLPDDSFSLSLSLWRETEASERARMRTTVV